MKPELNREYPDSNEGQLSSRMAKLTVDRMKPQEGFVRRAQHAKATGCAFAHFTVSDTLPEHLRHGIFREPGKSFEAIVRFSNAQEKLGSDSVGTARGMAIKLLNLTKMATGADPGDQCQDFLLVDHPVFPFATPAEYVRFTSLRTTPFGDLPALIWLGLFHLRHLRIILSIISKRVASPLELTYWSNSPYWLGPAGTIGGHAVKYSAVPRLKETSTPAPTRPSCLPTDYLSKVLANYLKANEAVFDFRVQLQTDPVAMPVEDVTVAWCETKSPPITIATLTIPKQDIASDDGRVLAERLEAATFSPWNALVEHRPMGGINRLRKAVYLASQAKRAKKAGN